MTSLYSIFHGNLQFSSIPKRKYKTVIDNCYWPLIKLVEKNEKLKLGIEFNGLTLLEIEKLDKKFLEKIKKLIQEERLEFIGSSYTQAIFPLIPYEVNLKNLQLGMKIYKKILGLTPEIFYVNEQAFSDGLISLYKEAGVKNIIVDFDSAPDNVRLNKSLLYKPVKIISQKGETLTVIWSSSIAFQKFQRYIFDEISFEDYWQYLSDNFSTNELRSFCLYAGDWEVFGFSPKIIKRNFKNDYKRMDELFDKFTKDKNLEFILPSKLLGKKITKLETSITDFQDPILCKKQEKYNVSRWALAGKNTISRNTQCYKLYKDINSLKDKSVDKKITDELKKNLVVLWGSDYRTSTTNDKNSEYENLYKNTNATIQKYLAGSKNSPVIESTRYKSKLRSLGNDGKIETDEVKLILDLRKGAPIRELSFPKIYPKRVAGLVPHGHFQNPKLSPDWFSSSCAFEAAEDRKYTDLSPTKIFVDKKPNKGYIQVMAKIKTQICDIEKVYNIYKNQPRVDLEYTFNFKKTGVKSARVGSITFDPLNFDSKNFWYSAVNGGKQKELYYMQDKQISHDGLISFRISSRGCLGSTQEWVAAGDNKKGILLRWDNSEVASCPILHFENTPQGLYGQIHHSFAESDETGYQNFKGQHTVSISIIGISSTKELDKFNLR